MYRTITIAVCAVLSVMLGAWADSTQNPPPCLEVSAEHPLFVFSAPLPRSENPADFAADLASCWQALPESLRPYSVLRLDPGAHSTPQALFEAVSPLAQQANVPVLLRLSGGVQPWQFEVKALGKLLGQCTAIKGVEVPGLTFDRYPVPGEAAALPAAGAYLVQVLEAAANYGRLVYVPLDGLHWMRVMSNPADQPLLDKMRALRNYIVPACRMSGPHTLVNQSAVMGLWLEGAAEAWGMDADGRWCASMDLEGPGRFAPGAPLESAAPGLFRAMVLNGAMGGACVYAFDPPDSLWMGKIRAHWDAAIRPALEELIGLSAVARKDFVLKRAKVALQLVEASNPVEFRVNLREVDAIAAEGFFVRGAYGVERPGQVPELVISRNGRFWVPLVSASAAKETLESFAQVVPAGRMASAAQWESLLDPQFPMSVQNTAFVSEVGRAVYVMNTRQHVAARQAFSIDQLPAPVRKVQAHREGATVHLTWPFRENDLSYKVYKRVAPMRQYTVVAADLDRREYTDPEVSTDATVSYAVTALTGDMEPYQDSVGYMQFRCLSTVESRIAEEVTVSPLLVDTTSEPVRPEPEPIWPPDALAWWPNLASVPPEQQPAAQAIAAQIETWDAAFTAGNLANVMAVYDASYADPQGWGSEYVRRAYQWIFERYHFPHMRRQIRGWDFTALASGNIGVLLYCRLEATAVSDEAGARADVPLSLPASGSAMIRTTWVQRDGKWNLLSTDPALPNFRDLLAATASPYEPVKPGPDVSVVRAPSAPAPNPKP